MEKIKERSLREYLEKDNYFSTLEEVKCTCNECFDHELSGDNFDRTYECSMCLREVPWCYGGSDEFSDFCDSCWCEADGFFNGIEIKY
jgi:hypothetical protein